MNPDNHFSFLELLRKFFTPGSGVTARPIMPSKHCNGRMAAGTQPVNRVHPKSKAHLNAISIPARCGGKRQ